MELELRGNEPRRSSVAATPPGSQLCVTRAISDTIISLSTQASVVQPSDAVIGISLGRAPDAKAWRCVPVRGVADTHHR